MEQLCINNISFTYSSTPQPVLTKFSFCFDAKKIFVVLGLNGAGKSTLLKIITQRYRNYEGTVKLDSIPVEWQQFSYMPQDASTVLFSHLTLRENILIAKNASELTSERKESIMTTLFPGGDILSHHPYESSGGQKQRSVLCRMLIDAYFFPISVFDEPFSQISHEAKIFIYQQLKEIVAATNSTFIIVSHDVTEAMMLADTVLVLRPGEASAFTTSHIHSLGDVFQEDDLREKILQAFYAYQS